MPNLWNGPVLLRGPVRELVADRWFDRAATRVRMQNSSTSGVDEPVRRDCGRHLGRVARGIR